MLWSRRARRTMEQRYKRPASWDLIEHVAGMHSVPVVGNGDVLTHYEARRRLDSHGCLAVMVGRCAGRRVALAAARWRRMQFAVSLRRSGSARNCPSHQEPPAGAFWRRVLHRPTPLNAVPSRLLAGVP